jgi:uncharacterized membrane protein YraQ (UPF0718 family)
MMGPGADHDPLTGPDEAGTAEPDRKPPPPLGRQNAFDGSFMVLAAIATCAGIAVAWTEGPARVAQIALDYLGFLAVLSPKILAGFLIAASVPILIPREMLTKWVGQESGLRGLVVASVAGALIPGGPMMIFPLAAGLRAAGATVSVLISFVTAWSLLSLNRTVIWEMSFLHIDFVLWRVLLCLPMPILAGWVAARVLR